MVEWSHHNLKGDIVKTYLIRLNGCPWFTLGMPEGTPDAAMRSAIYAVARGDTPTGITVEWVRP